MWDTNLSPQEKSHFCELTSQPWLAALGGQETHLQRLYLSLSYPPQLGSLILFCGGAVQLVFRSFSTGAILYVAVDLVCLWEEVSSGSYSVAILNCLLSGSASYTYQACRKLHLGLRAPSVLASNLFLFLFCFSLGFF